MRYPNPELRLHAQHGTQQQVRIHRRFTCSGEGLDRHLRARRNFFQKHHRRRQWRDLPCREPAMRKVWRNLLSHQRRSGRRHFVNFSSGDYRLVTTSPYARAGAGSTDLGANIAAIMLAQPTATGAVIGSSRTMSRPNKLSRSANRAAHPDPFDTRQSPGQDRDSALSGRLLSAARETTPTPSVRTAASNLLPACFSGRQASTEGRFP